MHRGPEPRGKGSAPAQDQRRTPTTPCPPDLRGKYVIYFMEGQETPLPVPDKDTVIIRITAEVDQEFELLAAHPMGQRE